MKKLGLNSKRVSEQPQTSRERRGEGRRGRGRRKRDKHVQTYHRSNQNFVRNSIAWEDLRTFMTSLALFCRSWFDNAQNIWILVNWDCSTRRPSKTVLLHNRERSCGLSVRLSISGWGQLCWGSCVDLWFQNVQVLISRWRVRRCIVWQIRRLS